MLPFATQANIAFHGILDRIPCHGHMIDSAVSDYAFVYELLCIQVQASTAPIRSLELASLIQSA